MKRKKPMKSKNKRIKQWITIKHKLFTMFIEKNITTCEVCKGKNYILGLSFHHRKPRNEVLLLCNTCHDTATKNKAISSDWFKQLRGEI